MTTNSSLTRFFAWLLMFGSAGAVAGQSVRIRLNVAIEHTRHQIQTSRRARSREPLS